MLDDRKRRMLAIVLVAAMAVAAALIVAGAAAFRAGPLIRNHTPLDSSLRGVFAGLGFEMSRGDYSAALIVMTLCYLALLGVASSVSERLAVAGIVVIFAIFTLGPPLLSSDIFNYVGYARLDVVHGMSPYESALNSAPQDPSYPHVGWAVFTTPYGPLFTLVTLPLGLVGLAPAVWALKGLSMLAALACLALVRLCAIRLGRDPVPAMLLFGLNPIVLAFALGGGHNDFLMMAAMLAGVYLLLGDRLEGMAALVAGAAVKAAGMILIPFAILGSKERWRALAIAAAAGAVVLAVSVAVFGIHLAGAHWLVDNADREQTPFNLPGLLLNDVLGLGLSASSLHDLGIAVAAPVVAWLLWRAYRGDDWLTCAGWAIATAIATTTWLLPWYVVWWLPLAAIIAGRAQRIAVVALTVLMVGIEVSLLL